MDGTGTGRGGGGGGEIGGRGGGGEEEAFFFSRKYCDCGIFFHRVTNLVTTLFPGFLGS